MIKVSIVIPVYNAEKYLCKCLDSIFVQTLKEIEVVCINDSSTDNSLDILCEYREKHHNMVVITQKNAGSGRARNVGINVAEGKYLMFVDPDDFLASDDAVETLYKAAEENHVAVCGGSMVHFIVSKNVIQRRFETEKEGMTCFRNYPFPHAHQRYIIQKELLVKNGIYYPDYRRGQDITFTAKMLNAVDKFYLISKDIYVYRKEHKELIFTEEKADDYICSLYDVVLLAVENELRELYISTVKELNIFAKKHWYRLLEENDTWDKVIRVNELIRKGNCVFQYDKGAHCLTDKKTYEEHLERARKELEVVESRLKEDKKFVIYGAGKGGRCVCRYLRKRGYQPFCFVVSSREHNAETVDDISVVTINELDKTEEYLFVLGALKEDIKSDMRKNLQSAGYNNILDFDCEMVIPFL